jgi:hypothetical protein
MMDKRTLGIASLSLALAAFALGGCGLGSADGDGDGGGEPGFMPSPLDKTLCHTDLTITGIMTPAPKPTDPDHYDPTLGETNCWPAGVWTFAARPATANEDGTPQCTTTALLPEYKVTGIKDYSVDGGLESYTFTSNPTQNVRLKVSSGGGGLCEGVFEIYSEDGKVLHNLHPALQPANGAATNPLTGHGEYQMFEVNQWIPQS